VVKCRQQCKCTGQAGQERDQDQRQGQEQGQGQERDQDQRQERDQDQRQGQEQGQGLIENGSHYQSQVSRPDWANSPPLLAFALSPLLAFLLSFHWPSASP